MSLTALTFYDCGTKGCALSGVPRQIRELVSSALPLHRPASVCGACATEMTRLASTVELEPEDVSAENVRAYVASQVAVLKAGGTVDRDSLASVQAALGRR